MARCALTFALAVVILGAPVATELCQIVCGADAMTSAGSAAHRHSCHPKVSTSGAAVNAAAHSCGHLDNLPAGREQISSLVVLPPLAPSLWWQVPLASPAAHFIAGVEHSPPGPGLTSQLRL